MKKPRPLNLAAGVSLLLAVVIVVLWIRSYARREAIGRMWETSIEDCTLLVESGYSSLAFEMTRSPDLGTPVAPSYGYWDWTWADFANSQDPPSFHWFPFPPVGFEHDYGNSWKLALAYWLLLPLTLVLPAVAIARQRRRRQRETNNLCPTCGYDLRATPDRCPECGAFPTSSAV